MRSKNPSMGISMECLLEIIDDFKHGAAEESTVRKTTWGVFKAYAFFLGKSGDTFEGHMTGKRVASSKKKTVN